MQVLWIRASACSQPIVRVAATRNWKDRAALTSARAGWASWVPDHWWHSTASPGCKCMGPVPENEKGATQTYHPKTGITARPHVHHPHSRSADLHSSGPASQRTIASLLVRYAGRGTGYITKFRFSPVRAVYAVLGVLSTESTIPIGL